MTMGYIIAFDQSTSATKALLFNEQGQCLDRESASHKQHYPQPGWVEHDAEEIWQNVLAVAQHLLARNQQHLNALAGISITNQRETIVVFDRATGKPLAPAIVWQCRRSEAICAAHIAVNQNARVQQLTGLRIDPYFSASKIQWLLENIPGLRSKIETGDALLGTMDTYLIYRLTQGQTYATDATNASRTLLYDISQLDWSDELCELWNIPRSALAEVRACDARFGESSLNGLLKSALPIVGVMGDSQAALFAQRCYEPGTAKVTFGTGSSILLNIGSTPLFSSSSLVTSLAWVQQGAPVYAFEGIIINSAATLEWLKNQLGLITQIGEVETLASEVSDSGGVFLVPAFSGLGLPYWQPNARAALVGLSAHSDRRHVVRAALESIAYQLRDALDAMQQESNVRLSELKADGGPTANKLLMQFTADITHTHLVLPASADCSALGACLMGLLGLRHYQSLAEIQTLALVETRFVPQRALAETDQLYRGWQQAIKQVLSGIH